MVKINSALLTAILFASFIGVCYSQMPINDTINLKKVEVIAKKIRQKDKSISPVQSISNQQLSIMSAENIGDAVKTFSGVIVKDYGGIGGLKTVMVRSLGSQHTAVYIDGAPISESSSGQIDLGKLHFENVDELSLTIGQQSILCQSARAYASASVINIKTSEPTFENKNTNTNVKFATKFGSFGQFSPYLMLQQRISPKISFEGAINYTTAKGNYPFYIQYGKDISEKAIRKNSDLTSVNFETKTIANLGKKTKLNASFYYYNSDRNLPGAVVLYNPTSNQSMRVEDIYINISLKHHADSEFQHFSNIKFSQGFLRYIDRDFYNLEGYIDNKYLQREYYLSHAVAYRLSPSLAISTSGDVIINTLSSNLHNYAYPTRYTGLFVVASQFNRKKFQAEGSLLGTITTDKTRIGNYIELRKEISPTFSAGYLLTSKPVVKARFLYKNIFRMPTFNDLYYTLIGNRELRPEFATQYNLGVIANLSEKRYISLKTDFYYNRIKDKIVAVPTKNLFEWQMQNIGEVEVKGAEVQLQIEEIDIWKFKITSSMNYSYQKSIDITKVSSSFGHQVPYMPLESFSSSISLNYRNLTLAFNSIYNGFRYILNENIYSNLLPSWWNSDFATAYFFNIKQVEIKVKAEIRNITNTQYEVIKNYPMSGRAYYCTIIFKY